MSIMPFAATDTPNDPFQRGSLATDFPLTPLTGVGAVVKQSWRVFWKEFPTIAILALIIFGPVEMVKSYFLFEFNQQENFSLGLRLDMWIGGILGALFSPAVIFAVMWRLRTGGEPEIGPSLRWGMRMWLRTFGYRLLAGVAIIVGLILLIIPGILIAVLLSLIAPVVAVEGDAQSNVLRRSWELARRHGWKILGASVLAFLVYFLMSVGVGLVFGVMMVFANHWVLSAALDTVLTMGFAFMDVLLLCIYLGIIAEKDAAADLPPGSLGISPPGGSYSSGDPSLGSGSSSSGPSV